MPICRIFLSCDIIKKKLSCKQSVKMKRRSALSCTIIDNNLTTQLLFQNRLRSPKASERQKEVIVEYFEENPQALRILNGTDNRAKQRVWIELTHKLNSLDGALKTTSKWGKYWNDIIIYTKTRAKTFISGECRCDRPPTETEQRILTLIGQLSLLKMWQQVWEKGVQKQAIETVVMKTESVDLQSHHSSEDDLDIAEYETMVSEISF